MYPDGLRSMKKKNKKHQVPCTAVCPQHMLNESYLGAEDLEAALLRGHWVEQVEVQVEIIPRYQLHGGGELNKREDTPRRHSSLVDGVENSQCSLVALIALKLRSDCRRI